MSPRPGTADDNAYTRVEEIRHLYPGHLDVELYDKAGVTKSAYKYWKQKTGKKARKVPETIGQRLKRKTQTMPRDVKDTPESNAYTKVMAMKEQFPDLKIPELCKKAGVKVSLYNYHRVKYNAVQKAKGGSIVPTVRHEKVLIPDSGSSRLIVIMGSPDQIREVLQ